MSDWTAGLAALGKCLLVIVGLVTVAGIYIWALARESREIRSRWGLETKGDADHD